MYPRSSCNQGRNTWLRNTDVVAKDSCCLDGVSNSCCLGVVSNRILPIPVNLVLLLLYLPRLHGVCCLSFWFHRLAFAILESFRATTSFRCSFRHVDGAVIPWSCAYTFVPPLSCGPESCILFKSHFRADQNRALDSL